MFEKQDRGCFLAPRRVFTRRRANSPPAYEEAYFARGLLAEDRRSHAREATESRAERRDACLSRKRAGKKAGARESRAEMAAAELNSCATGVRLTRQARLYFYVSL